MVLVTVPVVLQPGFNVVVLVTVPVVLQSRFNVVVLVDIARWSETVTNYCGHDVLRNQIKDC